jgi:hypothetical protein
LASGTFPASGFEYSYTVNGLSIGVTTPASNPGTPAAAPWTPPLPGVYSIVSTTSDGNGNTAVTQAVRYFATGTAIVSPEAGGTPPANGGQGGTGPGTLVPVGSSIVIQATSTPADGFVQRIDFYTDWTGNTATSTLIGTSKNYPYSVIYTPAGISGAVHLVKALAYDNNGNLVPASSTMDQVTLTLTTPSSSALPTCVIATPANNAEVEISNSGTTVLVSAAATSGATISKVQLYVNGVLLATDSAYPYTFTWTPTVTGVFELTALAYDNLGNVVASTTSTAPTNSPAPTTVTVESPLTVAINSPTAQKTISTGTTTTVTAFVADTNLAGGSSATISEVQFFQDSVLVGTATLPVSGSANNYQVTFTPNAPVGNGQSVLTAVATDSLGFIGVSAGVTVNVNVTAVMGTPTVIVSPVASNVAIGSSIAITANAAPTTGETQRIDFYTDWNAAVGMTGTVTGSGTLIGTSYASPYTVIYTPAGPAGTVHIVKALAYDNNGNYITGLSGSDTVALTMINPVSGGTTTCSIVTPTEDSLIEIPDYAELGSANVPVIVTAGTGATGSIAKVQLYINGALFGTQTAYPYTFAWTPAVTGVYDLTAIATDNHGNSVASSTSAAGTSVPGPTVVTIEAAPAVAITAPGNGGTLNSGAPTSVQATATDTNLDQNGKPVTIQQVQFFQDGNFVGVASSPTSGNTYTVVFKPVQLIVSNGSQSTVEPSIITAVATDTLGFTGSAPSITVNVTSGGTGTNVVIGTPPTVSLTAPTSQADVIVNTPVTLSATAAAPNGNIASVSFLVDDTVVTTLNQYPYSTTYTFQNTGTYQVVAQVVDNVGDKTSSSTSTVIVVPEPPPTVSITAPTSGGIVSVGSAVTVTAAATSPSGTIAKVAFYENGILISATSTAPYTSTFTPTSSGVYTFTAIATDNAGETTTSSASVVDVVTATAGIGTAAYFGQYQGLTDGGLFAFMVTDGTYGTYIGYSTSGSNVGAITYYTDLPVNASGSFTTVTSAASKTTPGITGTASSTGVSGNILPSEDVFIGAETQSGSTAVASGYYTGDLQGQPGSQFTGIVGADGSVMFYVSSGKFVDVGNGSVDSSGAFSLVTVKNNLLVGTVDPATGFLTGTISGSSPGTVLAVRVSGGTFSDGVLRNISTRGQVGTGANVMIAGFVIGGTTPKQLLVRAAGPTLSSFGLSGAIKATQLQIYSGTAVIASNTGWSSTNANAAAVSAADSASGAFAFPTGSADSALVGSFAPGNYTAMVSGVGSDTGLALVELYDLDPYSPFSPMKLVNISTRGDVGTGTNVLIGGFSIDGVAPKRLLIRGAGPALSALNVSGAIATPYLQLIDTATQEVIRDNYTWQSGNDVALVTTAEQATGAFTFANGSSDSAMLVVLPPGTYTVILSGAQSATGTGLVEIYEVP